MVCKYKDIRNFKFLIFLVNFNSLSVIFNFKKIMSGSKNESYNIVKFN